MTYTREVTLNCNAHPQSDGCFKKSVDMIAIVYGYAPLMQQLDTKGHEHEQEQAYKSSKVLGVDD